MESKFERLDGDKVKFDITISAQDVDAAINAVYKEVNKSARIPGFRKGKAPKAVLDSNFGVEYFTAQATENLIEDNAPAAVDEAGYYALRNYEYDTEELVTPGQDFSFSFSISVKPLLTLSSAEPVKVSIPSTKATDSEIDSQIDLLRGYYIDLKPVEDRPVQDDDIVVYSQECSVDGETIEEGTEERRTYVVGAGASVPEFDEQIIGMSKGETKEVELDASVLGLEGDYDKPVTAKITVDEITEKAMPELTDEWCKNSCDCESVQALRDKIAESIANEKLKNLERNKSIACLEELSSRLEGEIPEDVISDATTKALTNLYNNLQAQGLTLDQYLQFTGVSPDKFYEDMQEQGKELAKQDMALDALACALNMECTDDDISAAFEEAGVEDPEALRAEWVAEHRMSVLREEILRDKAAKWLYENAEVEYVDATDEPAEAEAASEDAAEAEAEPEAEADAE